MRKPVKGGIKIASYKEIPDIEGKRIYAVKTVGGERAVSYRDLEGNIYNFKGKKIGNIDY